MVFHSVKREFHEIKNNINIKHIIQGTIDMQRFADESPLNI